MTDVSIPQIGESITTAYISRWLVEPGQAVNAGDDLLEIDTDKASMPVPAPVSGVLVERFAEEGDEVEIGALVARIDENASVESPAVAMSPAPEKREEPTRAGPAARQAATEAGIDLQEVEGTGPRGRITTADVHNAKRDDGEGAASEVVAEPAGRVERVAMTPLRRTIARRLVQAQQEAAMLTTFNEVDMSAVIALRQHYQERFRERYGIKLGFMSFFVKAAIEALKAYPAVNAEIDGNDILYKNFYNIGIAVSGPKGLVVPVLRDADRLSFAQVEEGIKALALKARENRLRLDDFKDGTFTITNGGIFGSMMSTPILNPPQVGILGMHNIVERPVVVDGSIVARPMMYVALSYDHRIIDGREAVGFLVRIKECVENPERILLEV